MKIVSFDSEKGWTKEKRFSSVLKANKEKDQKEFRMQAKDESHF